MSANNVTNATPSPSFHEDPKTLKNLATLQGMWRAGSYAVYVKNNEVNFSDGTECKILQCQDYLELTVNSEIYRLHANCSTFTWTSNTRSIQWCRLRMPEKTIPKYHAREILRRSTAPPATMTSLPRQPTYGTRLKAEIDQWLNQHDRSSGVDLYAVNSPSIADQRLFQQADMEANLTGWSSIRLSYNEQPGSELQIVLPEKSEDDFGLYRESVTGRDRLFNSTFSAVGIEALHVEEMVFHREKTLSSLPELPPTLPIAHGLASPTADDSQSADSLRKLHCVDMTCQLKLSGMWLPALVRCTETIAPKKYFNCVIMNSELARDHNLVGLNITVPQDRIRQGVHEYSRQTASVSNADDVAWEIIQKGDIAALSSYIENGGNVDFTKNGRTILMDYLDQSEVKMQVVDALLEAAVDLKPTSAQGWSAIHFAARNPNPEVLELILRYARDDVLDLRTTLDYDGIPAGVTAQEIAALQRPTKQSCNSDSAVLRVNFGGDIRGVVIGAFSSQGFKLSFPCADLICTLAMEDVQFETEQLKTVLLIKIMKEESGQCMSRIEARNCLARVKWSVEDAISKLRQQRERKKNRRR